MSNLIKINKRSIKQNKDYGSQKTRVLSCIRNEVCFISTNIKVDILSAIEESFKDAIIESYVIEPNRIEVNLIFHEFNEKLNKKLYDFQENNEGLIVQAKVEHLYDTIKHLPIPKYSYEYNMNSIVTCKSCKAKIKFKDIIDDIDEEFNSTEICPKCTQLDTFDYEYESIDKLTIYN